MRVPVEPAGGGPRGLSAGIRDLRAVEEEAEVKLRKSPIGPILICMGLLGILPMKTCRPYLPRSLCLRLPTAHCVLTMLAVAVSMAANLWRSGRGSMEGSREPDHLKQVMQQLNTVPVLFIPVSWAGCHELTRLLPRDVCKYEIRHELVTRTELQWDRPYRQNCVLVTVTVAWFLGLAATPYGTGDEPLPYIISAMYGRLYQSLVFLYYVTWLSQICKAASSLLFHLQSIYPEVHFRSAARVREVRGLWIELREMLDSNRSLSWASGLGLLHLLVVLTVALHQLLYSGSDAAVVVVVLHVLAIGCAVLLIYLPCDRAHINMTLMNDEFLKSLDLITMQECDEATKREVNLFYFSVTAKPARASLAGFYECNRPLFSSIVSAIVTYCVVLMQFHKV